ncbi:MAG: xylulokinase [Chloroflexota bacterium]
MDKTLQPPYLIGIDVGTSSTKTVITDSLGQILTWKDQEYSISAPKPDWAEQDPELWLAATLQTLRAALADSGIHPTQVAGIGLAGQMHGLVCLDADGLVLRPAIIWADRRSALQVRQLTDLFGSERLAEWTGNPLATGFMLTSWAWLVENEPEIAHRTRHLLLPKDYVRYRLTGELGAEPSDASSTLLFDPHLCTWCKPLLQEIRLSPACLPPISPSASLAGGLLPGIASACGLLTGTPVIFGGSDVSLQALGQGIMTPGTVSCTIGTGGQLFAPISQPWHDPQLRLHLFCHAVPQHWHLESAILSAGLALRWLRDGFWSDQSYASLADQAQTVEAAFQGVFFLPYLAGERTPVMDPAAHAAFIGLGLGHAQPHMVRAVMEGVVFALRQGMELMLSLGVSVDRLVASGASIRHPLWLQLQADIFNLPIQPAHTPQATGSGAALLAGIGTNVYPDYQSALQIISPSINSLILPDPARVAKYNQAYQVYCQIYPAIKTIQPTH